LVKVTAGVDPVITPAGNRDNGSLSGALRGSEFSEYLRRE
jgi:hypothetical protein